MSGVYFFDTECTSVDDDREIIEAAYIPIPAMSDLAGPNDRLPINIASVVPERFFCGRFKPSKRSTLGAMAVHHILPHELEHCAPSSSFVLPADTKYIVGHKVDFDWEAAGKSEGVLRICTDAMARYVFPDVDSYSQSALLYHVLGATPDTRARLRDAHSAAADVLNNVTLLDHILLNVPEPITTWSELYAYSEACRIPRVMPIGEKQGLKGMSLDDAYAADPGFVGWCLRQDWLDPYLRTGLEQAIERANQFTP